MPRALVTGANGLVGGRLCLALLAAGWETRGLVRSEQRGRWLSEQGVELRLGDVSRPESLPAACDRCDVVYHAAGKVAAVRRAEFAEVNKQGTKHLASACAASTSPPVFVLVSSLAAAGPSTSGEPRRETEANRPVSAYGRSKLGAELAAREFAKDLPVTMVRPPMVLGPGDRSGLAMFRSIQRSGVFTSPGFRMRSYSIIDARDLATALIAAAERGRRARPPQEVDESQQGVYYATSDEQLKLSEIAQLVAAAVGRRGCRTLRIPPRAAYVAAAVLDAAAYVRSRPFIVSRDKIREATSGSWICSGERLFRETGFRVETPIAERIASTAAWYRDAGWL